MKAAFLIASAVATLFAGAAALAASQEPIQPIAPAKVRNPAMVELGKKAVLRAAPVALRLHLVQLLSQPEHGRF
ncbi:hypothetical protein [Gulbenkiania mobilis]|uniref:Uncharacterized protein n=1 Tax=Gulbenkiania mobilis TaxID=397457 RepID=A0ABY2CZD2_GULMO|nr:hypothetical protein EV669_102354 [Gulbenkiania mobilis]